MCPEDNVVSTSNPSSKGTSEGKQGEGQSVLWRTGEAGGEPAWRAVNGELKRRAVTWEI